MLALLHSKQLVAGWRQIQKLGISKNFVLNHKHPLAVLAYRMPCQEIHVSLAYLFVCQFRAGKKIEEPALFCATKVIAGAGVSNKGISRLHARLIVSIPYLKHAFNKSDEDLIHRWGEIPILHYFSGNKYFEHCWLFDSRQLVKFHKLPGEEGVEELLVVTNHYPQTMCSLMVKLAGAGVGKYSRGFKDLIGPLLYATP